MNAPNPALVTQRAAQRLPRVALLLFCAAYVIPGIFGRGPWKSADITSFGYMVSIAQGRTGWLAPTVGGLPADAALLPYWLGAVFIKLLGGWLDPAVAARIPFALLLVAVLVLTWYAAYHFARSEAAQPLPFAFGGEASPVDYARAIADGALLALIATLGLLQLGHETTPELAQLASVALYVYALATAASRTWRPVVAVFGALLALAASGAPSIAILLGAAGTVLCRRDADPDVRRFARPTALASVLAAIVATLIDAWGWRVGSGSVGPAQIWEVMRLFAWFMWPAWLLALWTVWRWRGRLSDRHIAMPLVCALIGTLASITMGGSDRALMLVLPPLAMLAAFALPTLQRSTAAAIDLFSVGFFSICAIVIWVIYTSMQTGVPAQPAINIARLARGFEPSFSPIAFVPAVLGTVAWLWLVRWRTGRTRHALWKSLVLAASGVSLCWLLVMTLLLPPLDIARGYRQQVQRIAEQLPPGACIAAPGMSRPQVVALEYLGGFRVDAVTPASATRCDHLLLNETRLTPSVPGDGWTLLARERRNTNDDETIAVYGRTDRGTAANTNGATKR